MMPDMADAGHNDHATVTSSSSPRKIFPGFLSEDRSDGEVAQDDIDRSTTLDQPSALPYLRQGSSTKSDSPGRKPRPPPLDLRTSDDQGESSRSSGLPTAGTGWFSARALSSGKRRPSPLQLDKSRAVGLDEELQEQRDQDGPQSALSLVPSSPDSLRDEMNDLTLLRDSVRQNLIARPVDSPLAASDSGGSAGALTPDLRPSFAKVADEDTISVAAVLDLLNAPTTSRHQSQLMILDSRPLGEFLQSHLPRSANLSIPSLIFKRLRKPSGSNVASWNSLGSFVTTPAGKDVWETINTSQKVDIVVLGLTAMDETAVVLRNVLADLLHQDVKVAAGGWAAVLDEPRTVEMLVSGEQSAKSIYTSDANLSTCPPPRSVPGINLAPPPMPANTTSPPRVAHHPSMPSLRPDAPGKRNVPSLSVHTGTASSRRPPKLSLNLDKPLKSATFGSFRREGAPANLAVPGRAAQHDGPPRSPVQATSFQTLCHAQAQLPPSPSSFGGVNGSLGDGDDLISPAEDVKTSPSPWTASRSTARPSGSMHDPPPRTPYDAISGSMTARTNGVAPFIVSTILPNFLYLGPEIASADEVEQLRRIGVKRILNVAIECEDDELRLKEKFDRYLKISMRDIVEETGMGRGIREACEFLDDARLHSAPTYVHCKAGKSRSVTVVLAYLIHANAWTLKTAYAYVAERRKGISPNIGFVAELMQYEETELGLKQSGGVHGESRHESNDNSDAEADASTPGQEKKGNRNRTGPRHMRESLPPAWAAASLDAGTRVPKVALHGDQPADEGKQDMGDDREVRKNGQWVHHRRAPVDRTTLQPGRRVSKAGLESLRPLASASAPRPSPKPSPRLMDGGEKPHTPSAETRIGWV